MRVLSKTHHTQGVLLLILTTIVWGTSFPLLKQALQDLTPPVILAVRFTIAAIALFPYLYRLNWKLLQAGVVLGLIYFTQCWLALSGLETISANRSAFLVSLNAILVPILARGLGRRLSLRVVASAGVAIAGIGLLSWEGGGWGWGDLLTLGCAISVAIYILILEGIAPQYPTLPLVAVQLMTMAVLSSGWVLWQGQFAPVVSEVKLHFNALTYLGLGVTALPLWTQAVAQRSVTAAEAALLYTLEPVFAGIFSFVLLGEVLGVRGMLGAALIVAATIYSQLPNSSKVLQ